MKTDELIALLAADTSRREPPDVRLAKLLPLALAAVVAAIVLFWGVRPDLASALTSPAALKTLVPAALATLAAALALNLARPGVRPRWQATVLGLVFVGLLGIFLVVLANAGQTGLVTALARPSFVTCLVSVPLLALPILGAMLWALSAGAPIKPARTGAIAGLAAASLTTTAYSLYCNQDIVLFVLPAYGVAIFAVTALGAALGRRLLRW